MRRAFNSRARCTREVTVTKRKLIARRDLRVVESLMDDLLQLPPSDDYVFVRLTDATSVTSPMERIRTVFPHAMHVERKVARQEVSHEIQPVETEKIEDIDLFRSFYRYNWRTARSRYRTSIYRDATRIIR